MTIRLIYFIFNIRIMRLMMNSNTVAIWIILMFLSDMVSMTYSFDSSYFNGLKRVDNVHISHRVYRNQRRSLSRQTNPDVIYTTITDVNRTTTLRFQKNTAIKYQPTVLLTNDNGKLNRIQNNECTGFYVDKDKFAHSVVDSCRLADGIVHVLAAEVVINGDLHVVLPEGSAEDGSLPQYHLYQVKPSENIYYDYEYINGGIDVKEDSKQLSTSRFRRQTTRTYVELYLVLDFSLYTFWRDKTPASSTSTISKINTFYAFFAQGVDLRYKSLAASYKINLEVELIGIYISQTAVESPYTANADTSSSTRGVVDSEKVLADFKSWVDDMKNKNATFPRADHYMLLTGRELSLQGNLGSAGYSNVDSICTNNSVSVVEDKFDFLSLVIAAHELGHSLSGKHDGDVPGCNNSDGYILSASNQALTGDRATHPWMFSTCSAASFQSKLNNLQLDPATNCLTSKNAGGVIVATGTPPGQIYTPDQQCRFIYGTSSAMVRTQHYGAYDKFCTGMWCTASSINTANLVIPAEGTTCGNQKWCWNGKCVQTNQAPAADETCLHGDQPGEFVSGTTCSSTVGVNIGFCYDSTVYRSCCASCNAAKLNIPDCPYGDRNKCETINAWQCYDRNSTDQTKISVACCKTCDDFAKKFSSLPQSCKYGDTYINCATSSCSQYPIECCATCNGYTQPTNINPTSTSSVKSSTATTTPTKTTSRPVEPEKPNTLPDWVIPVAAGGGGFLVLCVIIACIVYCYKNRNTSYTDHKTRSNQRDRYRRKSSGDRRRSSERGRSEDKRRRSNEKRGSGDRRPKENWRPSNGYTNNGNMYPRY